MIHISIRWDMRLTDKEILRVISELTKPASFDEIAQMADCSRTTVYNSIRRLSKKNIISISREAGRRYPAQYQVNSENLPECMRPETK